MKSKQLTMEVRLNNKVEGYVLNGMLWTPDDESEVKYFIQIVHGMTEHIGRYEGFAKAMTERGFAVGGFDLRGHGMNDGDSEVASFISGATMDGRGANYLNLGWGTAVSEVYKIHKEFLHMFPLAKHFMMGFSLGSFLVRDFMREYIVLSLDGFILAGTGYQPKIITSVMGMLVKAELKRIGVGQTSNKIRNLAFGEYNKKFKPCKTRADWLCSDNDELQMYLSDPAVRKDISADLFLELLSSMSRTGGRRSYRLNNGVTEVPVLVLSGSKDPVGGFGKGVFTVISRMKSEGVNVEYAIFDGARHDIFHEYANGTTRKVISKICGWASRINNGRL